MRVLPALLCSACAAFCQDAGVSGNWSGIFREGPIYVILQQDGSKLSGSGGPTKKQQMLDFKNGSVEGSHVVFAAGPMHFELQLEGETMRGEMTINGESSKVYLKRAGGKSGPAPTFEVASVKPSHPPDNERFRSSMKMDPGRITCTNTTLKRFIIAAYDMKDYQVIGPSWIDSERYDIVATMPRDSTSDEVLRMLQGLIAERFHLAFHNESRELPVYALATGKAGHKLKEVEFGRGSSNISPGKLEAHSIGMANLTDMLSRMVERPVIDATGLKGFFDFNLEWTPDDAGAASRPAESGTPVDSAVGPNLIVALQQQLGLKLEPRKAPLDVMVIDRVEKIPTEN
jgi:uncharacterized protein (TIGR03435 family)